MNVDFLRRKWNLAIFLLLNCIGPREQLWLFAVTAFDCSRFTLKQYHVKTQTPHATKKNKKEKKKEEVEEKQFSIPGLTPDRSFEELGFSKSILIFSGLLRFVSLVLKRAPCKLSCTSIYSQLCQGGMYFCSFHFCSLRKKTLILKMR